MSDQEREQYSIPDRKVGTAEPRAEKRGNPGADSGCERCVDGADDHAKEKDRQARCYSAGVRAAERYRGGEFYVEGSERQSARGTGHERHGTGAEAARRERLGAGNDFAEPCRARRLFALLSDPQHKAGVTLSVLENAGSQSGRLPATARTFRRISAWRRMNEHADCPMPRDFRLNIGNNAQAGKNGQAKKTTAASITLYNKDRKVLWSTP